MKVWISNYAGHNYDAALKYGEFQYITRGYVSFQSLDRVKYVIAEKVALTDKEDWLLISGRPLISILAVVVWLAVHKQVKILHWDQKGGEVYREMIITAENIAEMMNVINGAHG